MTLLLCFVCLLVVLRLFLLAWDTCTGVTVELISMEEIVTGGPVADGVLHFLADGSFT